MSGFRVKTLKKIADGQNQVLYDNTYKIPVENRFFALFYTHKFRFFNFWAIFQPILKIFVLKISFKF